MADDRPPEAHLPLHPLEFQILLVLAEGAAHAYAIVQTIEDRQPSWSTILPTNMYRRIWRLASEGLVELDRTRTEASPRRKYFGITALGRRVAAAETARLRALLAEATRAGIEPISGGPR